MKANNLNDAEHQFLKVRMNPITMIYSFPVKSETIIPSYDNMVKTIEQRLVENDVLKPNYQFSFTIKQISSYLQLYPYFGEEIDLFSYFGITSRHLTSRTAAILDISQSFFSVNMDLPENLSDDPQVHEQMDELIYVNSIEFGRRTVLVVESNVGYQDLSVALNELLDNAYVRCMPGMYFICKRLLQTKLVYLKKDETVMTEVSINVCIGIHGPIRMSLSTEHGRSCSKRWVSVTRC